MTVRRAQTHFLLLVILVLLTQATGYTQPLDWTWAESISASGDQFAIDMISDPGSGDIIIIGEWSTDLSAVFPTGIEAGNDFASTYGGSDGFMARYDASGILLWAFKFGGDADDHPGAIAMDSEGNLYMTGSVGPGTIYFSGNSVHSSGSTLINEKDNDFFLVKYNPQGEFQWARYSESTKANVAGLDLYVGPSEILVAGIYDEKVDFGMLSTSVQPNLTDLFIIKYTLNGFEQWLIEAGSNGDDIPVSILADAENLYLTGYFDGSLLNVRDIGGGVVDNFSNINLHQPKSFLVSYSLAGDYSWGDYYFGEGDKLVADMVLDESNLYLATSINGTTEIPGETDSLESPGNEILLSSINKITGASSWNRLISGGENGNISAKDLFIYSNYFLYLAGTFDDSLLFSSGEVYTSNGSDDLFLASYTVDGVYNWSHTEGSIASDLAVALAKSENSELLVLGEYEDDISLGSHVLTHLDARDILFGQLEIDECIPAIAGELLIEDDTLCEGSLLNLSLESHNGLISWQESEPGLALWSTLPGETDSVLNIIPDQDRDYRAFVTMPGCDSDSSAVAAIKVLSYPIPDPGSGGETCDTSFVLKAEAVYDKGFWSVVGGPGEVSFGSDITGDSILVIISEAGNYKFSWTESNGACMADSVIEVVFHEPPRSVAGPDAEFCSEEGLFQLSESSSANGSVWWTTSGNGTFNDQSLDNPGYNISNEISPIYLIKTVNGPAVCSPAIDSMQLTITPRRMSDAGENVLLCNTETFLQIFGTSSANGDILWSTSGNGTFNDSTLENPVYYFGEELDSIILTKTVSGPGNCPDGVDHKIILRADKPQAFAGDDQLVCSTDTYFDLTEARASGGVIKWYTEAGGRFNDPEILHSRYYPEEGVSTVYLLLEVVSEAGCGITRDSMLLTVVEAPVAVAGPDQELEYTASAILAAEYPGYGSGSWTVQAGPAFLADPSYPYTGVENLSPGENIFRWTVTSEVCPESYDEVSLFVENMIVPTIFTPNEDGKNDYLEFDCVTAGFSCSIVIFNRWGNEVFRSEDYQNNWDGKDHKGRILYPDTYYYILRSSDGMEIKSFIEIRR